jgi:hypothetical protein
MDASPDGGTVKGAADQVQQELASLGLDDEPPVEPEVPPENQDEPTGVDDPADEPDDTDREHAAKTAQALARAVDQLGVSFEHLMNAFKEVRSSAHALVEALEPVRGSELVEEEEPEAEPASADTDEGEPEEDGEVDHGEGEEA